MELESVVSLKDWLVRELEEQLRGCLRPMMTSTPCPPLPPGVKRCEISTFRPAELSAVLSANLRHTRHLTLQEGGTGCNVTFQAAIYST